MNELREIFLYTHTKMLVEHYIINEYNLILNLKFNYNL